MTATKTTQADATPPRCPAWSDRADEPVTDDTPAHIHEGWIASIDGASIRAVDNPGGQPSLILSGSVLAAEVTIADPDTAPTATALLAALGHDDIANLIRTGLSWTQTTETPRHNWRYGDELIDSDDHLWLSVAVAPGVSEGSALVGMHDHVVRSIAEVADAVGPLSLR